MKARCDVLLRQAGLQTRFGRVRCFAGCVAPALLLLALVSVLAPPPSGYAAGREPMPSASTNRPPILGVAHIGLMTGDLETSRQFYGRVLGFEEPFKLNHPDGSLMLTYFKVNDHQYIEIFPTLKSPTEDRLSHIAFETTDAKALRDYLASNDVKVPGSLSPGLDGNLSFMVSDPDGHRVEFVQYMPGSLHSRSFGKSRPAARVSDHIQHVGVTVKDRAAADRFYKDILGFRLLWEGGPLTNLSFGKTS